MLSTTILCTSVPVIWGSLLNATCEATVGFSESTFKKLVSGSLSMAALGQETGPSTYRCGVWHSGQGHAQQLAWPASSPGSTTPLHPRSLASPSERPGHALHGDTLCLRCHEQRASTAAASELPREALLLSVVSQGHEVPFQLRWSQSCAWRRQSLGATHTGPVTQNLIHAHKSSPGSSNHLTPSAHTKQMRLFSMSQHGNRWRNMRVKQGSQNVVRMGLMAQAAHAVQTRVCPGCASEPATGAHQFARKCCQAPSLLHDAAGSSPRISARAMHSTPCTCDRRWKLRHAETAPASTAATRSWATPANVPAQLCQPRHTAAAHLLLDALLVTLARGHGVAGGRAGRRHACTAGGGGRCHACTAGGAGRCHARIAGGAGSCHAGTAGGAGRRSVGVAGEVVPMVARRLSAASRCVRTWEVRVAHGASVDGRDALSHA